jgi:sigma-B regulation protein RsbU (phosphoserine phosphatase)
MEGADMEEREIVLCEEDTVIFYTDGVIEATGEGLEQFGIERLLKVTRDNSHLPAADLVRKIAGEVVAFSGDRPQFDDITLMVLKGRRSG